jgi:hypothetical protein
MFYILIRSFLYSLSGSIINKNSDSFLLVKPVVALRVKTFIEPKNSLLFVQEFATEPYQLAT